MVYGRPSSNSAGCVPHSKYQGIGWFARLSYSYYLLNVPVLWLIWFVPSCYAPFANIGPIAGGLLSGIVATILTVPIAYLSYRYVERYFISVGVEITNLFSKRKEC
jgi:peptidoglycan/LPS O-acetylase OafA/YrhL